MAFVRPFLGKVLSSAHNRQEVRAIERGFGNDKPFRIYGLSQKEAQAINSAARNYSEGFSKELQMWAMYSRFFHNVIVYKLVESWNRINDWLDRPFFGFRG